MAQWAIDDPNVLGFIVGLVALGFAVVIFTLQYRIDRYVHAYVKQQDRIQESIRQAAFGQIRNYLLQSSNEIGDILVNREDIGNDEQALSELNEYISTSSFKHFGSAIKQQLSVLTPYIDAQYRKAIDDTASSIEMTGKEISEDRYDLEPDDPEGEPKDPPPFPDQMMYDWEIDAENLSSEINRLVNSINKGGYE